jgi:predicted transcriptional regulator
MTGTTTLTVRMPPAMKKGLEKLARSTRRSKSYLAAEAIAAYLELQAWQVEKVRAGLRDLEAGRSVPDEEVKAWVESWDTPHERPQPKCEE